MTNSSNDQKQDAERQEAEKKKLEATEEAMEERERKASEEQKVRAERKRWQEEELKKLKEITVPSASLRQHHDFWRWMEALKGTQKEYSADELAKQFLLFVDDQTKGGREKEWQEKIKRWQSQRTKKPSQIREVFDEVAKSWRDAILIGKGSEIYIYERIMGALLDERVNQIHSANLNARDRFYVYKKALEKSDKFEAQALLLSLGQTSDFDEEYLEHYYRAFAKWEAAPMLDSKNLSKEDQIEAKKERLVEDHPGDYDDFVFESKLRRETKGKGHRPDVWHNGSRDIYWDEEEDKFKICFKSTVWIDRETNYDAELTPGRKGDTAPETQGYARIDTTRWFTAQEYVEATVNILNQRLATGQQKLEEHREALAVAEKNRDESLPVLQTMLAEAPLDQQSGLEGKIKYLKDEATEKKRQLKDHQEYLALVERRLRVGVHPGDLKSFLLDSNAGYDSYYEFEKNGKTVKIYEKDVAISRSTFLYWVARNDRDADVICNGEHVTANERNTHAELYGSNYFAEISWRAKNHVFGIKVAATGSYDKARDGSSQLLSFMVDPEGRGSANFTLMSRGWAIENLGDEKGNSHIIAANQEDKYVYLDNDFRLEESEIPEELRPVYQKVSQTYQGGLFNTLDGLNASRINDFDFADLQNPQNRLIKMLFDKAVENATVRGNLFTKFNIGAKEEELTETPEAQLPEFANRLMAEQIPDSVKEMPIENIRLEIEKLTGSSGKPGLLAQYTADLVSEENYLDRGIWRNPVDYQKKLSPSQQKKAIRAIADYVRELTEDYCFNPEEALARTKKNVELSEEETAIVQEFIAEIFERLMRVYRVKDKILILKEVLGDAGAKIEELEKDESKRYEETKNKIQDPKTFYQLARKIQIVNRGELTDDVKREIENMALPEWQEINQNDALAVQAWLAKKEIEHSLIINHFKPQPKTGGQ